MSLATSYRYEAMTEKKSLQNALQRQNERIRNDEMMAAREGQAKLEKCISLKSEWNENLAHVAEIQKMKTDLATANAELAIERKASIMVRKAALKQLLEKEYQLYEAELHNTGKAFYIKRT